MLHPSRTRRWLGWFFAAAMASFPLTAAAHETDQFTVPQGRELADVGDYLNELFVERLQLAVDRVNAQIRRAVEDEGSLRTVPRARGRGGRPRAVRSIDPEDVLAAAHAPEGVAEVVWQSFGAAVDLIELLNTELHSDEVAERYPGKIAAFKATDEGASVYNGLYFALDPRTAFRLYHATAFKAFDTWMGADKIGHFTDMGYLYYKAYRKALREGKTTEEAMAEARRLGTRGAISERGLLGNLTAGAYSNADLASNYVGCLFYRNLTEPVMLEGELRQPMLVREGPYWKLADFVTEDPRFLDRFISDHYDEALNPSLFEGIIRPTLREKVVERCPMLLTFYDRRFDWEDPETFFLQMMTSLSTYYGDDYGHRGEPEELVGIWNACPQALRDAASGGPSGR